MTLDAGAATAWMDRWWDPDAALLWNMPGSFDALAHPQTIHLVPQSAWCALGLLQRGEGDDVDRAVRTIEAVCATQYDEPGTVWHGTFSRFLEWPRPGADAAIWVDYDPNWRQFVGTTFGLILMDLVDRLPTRTVEAMRAAMALAATGEPEGRVAAWYSNIALMKAWLDVEVGRVAEGEALAEEVVTLFRRHGAFLEYGSPTYYGIDLYALALWRTRSSSARLRAWGEELDGALWRDIARWYHAGLGNLCGPYARAYGMDMTGYAALLGLWIADAVGEPAGPVPLPVLEDPVDHGHDLTLAPCVALLGAVVPDDAQPALVAFGGERVVEQQVDEDLGLVATGWLAEDRMVGAARGAPIDAVGQYHPATIHWRHPDGSVAWVRLSHRGRLDAVAGPGTLTVTTSDHPDRGPTATKVRSSHPGRFTDDTWTFPGLDIRVVGAPETSPDGVLDTTGTTTFALELS